MLIIHFSAKHPRRDDRLLCGASQMTTTKLGRPPNIGGVQVQLKEQHEIVGWDVNQWRRKKKKPIWK